MACVHSHGETRWVDEEQRELFPDRAEPRRPGESPAPVLRLFGGGLPAQRSLPRARGSPRSARGPAHGGASGDSIFECGPPFQAAPRDRSSCSRTAGCFGCFCIRESTSAAGRLAGDSGLMGRGLQTTELSTIFKCLDPLSRCRRLSCSNLRFIARFEWMTKTTETRIETLEVSRPRVPRYIVRCRQLYPRIELYLRLTRCHRYGYGASTKHKLLGGRRPTRPHP
eukprot:SAG22_NODE_2218_length_2823_cov_7.009912_2_plen_225_part_00